MEPDWGLYNGAIGTVKEIVYTLNKSPIDDDLPEFVLVEFTQYCGPPWMTDKPMVSLLHPQAMLISVKPHKQMSMHTTVKYCVFTVGSHSNYQTKMQQTLP